MSDTLEMPSGDMPPEEFRRHAHQVVDWMADYLAGVGDYPVMAQVRPGEVAARLPASAPDAGEPVDDILRDFRDVIIPGITHWNHPDFFAYFSITGSGPGILGEMLAAALNTNAMLWRTGPAPTELEARTLDWLRQMMGLPEGFHGTIQDTASMSTLIAIAAAREAAGLDVREQGMSGRELPKMRVYASEEVHSSIDKAGITLGLGRTGTRKIATDDRFRMDPAALEQAIVEDRAAGILPLCVVATTGTTSTSSIDPVAAIAVVCERHGVWLHVDAAYGGSAALVPELRGVLDGAERADSLVVNPHKWMFVPIDCSVLFTRRPEIVRRAFSLVPEYLVTPEGEGVTNLMDYGPALGKRFRSLKLWMTLRYFGAEGMASRIREHCRLATLLASWIDGENEWEMMAPVPLSLVVFRHAPRGMDDARTDAHNERLLAAVNAGGRAYLSHTRVRGRLALRLAIGNLRTTEEHVRDAWALLRQMAAEVRADA
ncbi:pyridoxal phosphate-dependent decarboxylase family protein [Longimicrobium terrae]|uniref:Aromatic-L-amino-acid decarboxylase n=1 Tax=Longimicrobium terrae TaxID=1639882 RepID=A0A841H5B2_9BACT|nr:pyridoxal-dependent decarboxylase [Longimicrobium terrae]MBB4639078.1 aromatic-L-amino-acid decarboxylase [Longimicrobium terrae]MBB6073321.1 aromatic-L-amino-acid decarboxylase [Longimicrobium terrae]NNC28760.1 amino acid decarboxylase [Longimicrobium terrae]